LVFKTIKIELETQPHRYPEQTRSNRNFNLVEIK
jgi:hypothetical protein